MSGAIHRRAKSADAAGNAGRRLVVDDDDRFDLRARRRRASRALELGLGRTPAPVARHVVDLQAQPLGDCAPYQRKMTGLENQHAIARRKRVHERRFGGAGPGRRER